MVDADGSIAARIFWMPSVWLKKIDIAQMGIGDDITRRSGKSGATRHEAGVVDSVRACCGGAVFMIRRRRL